VANIYCDEKLIDVLSLSGITIKTLENLSNDAQDKFSANGALCPPYWSETTHEGWNIDILLNWLCISQQISAAKA